MVFLVSLCSSWPVANFFSCLHCFYYQWFYCLISTQTFLAGVCLVVNQGCPQLFDLDLQTMKPSTYLSFIQVAVYCSKANESSLTTPRTKAVGDYCPHLNGDAEMLARYSERMQWCCRSSMPSTDCQHRLSNLTPSTLIMARGE